MCADNVLEQVVFVLVVCVERCSLACVPSAYASVREFRNRMPLPRCIPGPFSFDFFLLCWKGSRYFHTDTARQEMNGPNPVLQGLSRRILSICTAYACPNPCFFYFFVPILCMAQDALGSDHMGEASVELPPVSSRDCWMLVRCSSSR